MLFYWYFKLHSKKKIIFKTCVHSPGSKARVSNRTVTPRTRRTVSGFNIVALVAVYLIRRVVLDSYNYNFIIRVWPSHGEPSQTRTPNPYSYLDRRRFRRRPRSTRVKVEQITGDVQRVYASCTGTYPRRSRSTLSRVNNVIHMDLFRPRGAAS